MTHFNKRKTPDKTKRDTTHQAHTLYVTSQNTKQQLFQTVSDRSSQYNISSQKRPSNTSIDTSND